MHSEWMYGYQVGVMYWSPVQNEAGDDPRQRANCLTKRFRIIEICIDEARIPY